MGPKVKPEQRRRVHEFVAERLEGMIRGGEVAPGERFPSERELMALLGVGRSAVREGLLLLQRRGLVRLSSGERAQVTLPDPGQIVGDLSTAAKLLLARPGGVRHFQGARALIEISLARHAALNATPTQIEELHAALERNRQALADRERFVATDLDFHSALARIAGNQIVTALQGALVEWLTEQRRISGQAPDTGRLALEGHEQIFWAVEAGDVLGAQQAMQEHLEDVARRYWRVLSADGKAGA